MPDNLKEHIISQNTEEKSSSSFTANSRFEFKYHILEQQVPQIIEDLKPFCVYDEVLRNGERQYTITSLYLDSPNLDIYWEKKLLQFARLKVRIRTYGISNDGNLFLEIKRRFGDVIVKSRCRVKRDSWHKCITDPLNVVEEEIAEQKNKKGIIKDFCYQIATRNLTPLIFIRYEREPFIGRQDKRIRVTFDRNLRFAKATGIDFPSQDSSYYPADFAYSFGHRESRVILEMKFTGGFPLWMQEIVERHDLLRDAFSKFARCVDLMLLERYSYNPTLYASCLE